MKAKTIDRLELTRQKFSRSQNETPQEAKQGNNPEALDDAQTEHFGLSTCPNCEQLTLIHEGGCEHCTNCGWSACG